MLQVLCTSCHLHCMESDQVAAQPGPQRLTRVWHLDVNSKQSLLFLMNVAGILAATAGDLPSQDPTLRCNGDASTAGRLVLCCAQLAALRHMRVAKADKEVMEGSAMGRQFAADATTNAWRYLLTEVASLRCRRQQRLQKSLHREQH